MSSLDAAPGPRSAADAARAWGPALASARVREHPEDFEVDEVLGFEPDGDGEHLLVQVRKRGLNTDWVARCLARAAGLPPSRVSYAGLKDRDAVTSQWFSLHLGARDVPEPGALAGEGFEVLALHRHRRKLRRGALRGNRFRLVLRGLGCEPEPLARRLAQISADGVPNYFGAQRFGLGAANLPAALAMFRGARVRDRHRRGLYLSAARSLLFNRVLDARVRDGSWSRPIPGDALVLDGSHSYFVAESIDAVLAERAMRLDVHPSGPLWGCGEPTVRHAALELEVSALRDTGEWQRGLEAAGLKQERRALRVRVQGLEWAWDAEAALTLSFTLAAGSYATAVLRELVTAPGLECPVGG